MPRRLVQEFEARVEEFVNGYPLSATDWYAIGLSRRVATWHNVLADVCATLGRERTKVYKLRSQAMDTNLQFGGLRKRERAQVKRVKLTLRCCASAVHFTKLLYTRNIESQQNNQRIPVRRSMCEHSIT